METGTEVETRIRPLTPAMINKIAAGEVIERPASVVKELLENSLDALATRIDVEVVAGGTELIRIVDNGEGIHADDLPLAVASHATSKLQEADDLFRVHTMGFRGEALASIAEVSSFRIRSRRAEAHHGAELSVDAGRAGAPCPCGCPPGTLIEVRSLFLNTPVRRKFLKAQSTEFAHIAEQFTRVALANPHLYMSLRHGEKRVHELPVTPSVRDRLELFYGRELADDLIEIEADTGVARLWGYVAPPRHSKSTRKGQYLFLNGRYIQDRSLQHALGEAYRGLLMVGRQPIAFLFLEVPPDQVDVNVHPTKSEVRFRDAPSLYRLLLGTLRTRFLGLNFEAPLHMSRPTGLTLQATDPDRQREVQQELVAWATQQLDRWPDSSPVGESSSHELIVHSREELLHTSHREPTDGPGALSGEVQHKSDFADEPADAGTSLSVSGPEARRQPLPVSGDVRAMQVHDCYLVVETGGGLTVIDQHALHERILYERLRTRVLGEGVDVQRLLVPVTVELTTTEAALVMEHGDLLRQLGLPVEDFGGSTVALTGLPVLLQRVSPLDLIRGVVELLETHGANTSRRDLLDGLLHMLSCKAAIKAGQRLSPEEIDSLLAMRHLVDDAHHCPHGRPTALTLTREQLDRQFGRMG